MAIIPELHLPIPPSPPPAKLSRKLLRLNSFFAFCLLAAVAGFIGWRIATHNEGVVRPGELYRSGQLDGPELARVVRQDGIKTVINLRGPNPKSAWYRDETGVCAQLGVQHLDVSWSATHLPPPQEVAKLLEGLRGLPRPILLHCRSGSDRTGLASAIYLIDEDHVPWSQASQALTWHYGHFAVYPYFPMNEFLVRYRDSGRASVEAWVARDYPAIYARESGQSKWHEMIESIQFALWGSLGTN